MVVKIPKKNAMWHFDCLPLVPEDVIQIGCLAQLCLELTISKKRKKTMLLDSFCNFKPTFNRAISYHVWNSPKVP